MLQGSFLPQECQGDGKLGHLVIKKLHPCEKAIPSPVSFNKLLQQFGMHGVKEHEESPVLFPFTPSSDSRTHNQVLGKVGTDVPYLALKAMAM